MDTGYPLEYNILFLVQKQRCVRVFNTLPAYVVQLNHAVHADIFFYDKNNIGWIRIHMLGLPMMSSS